jgi:hypothetical protein
MIRSNRSRRQVGLICLTYRPRKPAFRIVAARLALAA